MVSLNEVNTLMESHPEASPSGVVTPKKEKNTIAIRTESDTISAPNQYQCIPQALKSRKQWLCWRFNTKNGRRTKVPINPLTGNNTSSPDAAWTYDECRRAADSHARHAKSGGGIEN